MSKPPCSYNGEIDHEALGRRIADAVREPHDSCDSPELAACRRLLTTDDVVEDYELLTAVSTLLLMVDELRADRDDEIKARLAVERVASNYERDLHEPRVKLAEAERATGAYMRQFFAEQKSAEAAEARVRELEAKLTEMNRWHESAVDAEAERAAECKELRAKLAEEKSEHQLTIDQRDSALAKLAEAEHKAAHEYRLAVSEHERAEACVKMLAEALFAATGGHVDLDRPGS